MVLYGFYSYEWWRNVNGLAIDFDQIDCFEKLIHYHTKSQRYRLNVNVPRINVPTIDRVFGVFTMLVPLTVNGTDVDQTNRHLGPAW